jgi:hypothetical protein
MPRAGRQSGAVQTMTTFREGKPRMRIEDGKRVFEWPIESRDEGSAWREVENYPTRLTCRLALKRIRTEERVHRARLARA